MIQIKFGKMVFMQNQKDYNVVSKYGVRNLKAFFTPEKSGVEESEFDYVMELY